MELLSRLKITGTLDTSTPIDVILEIADVHNIDTVNCTDIQMLIDEINKEDVPTLEGVIKKEDYVKIAKFVNSDVDWNLQELQTAYNFLKSFENPKEFQDITPSFICEPQTMENLNSLNSSVVYAACRHFDIELNINDSIDDMCNELRIYLSNKEIILESIVNKLIDLEIPDLIKLKLQLIQSNKSKIKNTRLKKKFKVTYDDLKVAGNKFNTYYPTKSAISEYEPENITEAVAIAYIYYNADITETSDPMVIVNQLQQNKCKLKLNSRFNINFPYCLYSSDNLNNLLLHEGYLSHELMDLENIQKYELIGTISISNTFHQGILKPCINKETLKDLIKIEDLPVHLAVSYGCNEYYIFTYLELYEHFNSTKILTHPITKETLNDIEIRKLVYLCDSVSIQNKNDINLVESIEDKNTKAKLLELLRILGNNDTDNIIKILLSKINEDQTGMNREIIEKIFTLLTKLAMNMRGWNDQEDYPIEQSFQLDAIIIEERVGRTLHELDIYSNNFQEIVELIYKLPLVKYYQGNYIQSTQETGLTIKDRINIIKNKQDDESSCIRLSSNYILATIYKNCQILNVSVKFDIKKVRYIA
jgi:hypothetical protein